VPLYAGSGVHEPDGMSVGPVNVIRKRIATVAVAATIGLSVAGCGGVARTRVSGHVATTPAATTTTATATAAATLPLQAGYRGPEDFCAETPLTGHVLYDGTTGQLVPSVLMLGVAGLPPNSVAYVDWSNDQIRGYIIASFRTDSAGTPIPSSVSMGRLAEVRGVEMVLESVSLPPTVFGRLEPC
jgi:hypothetical protein